MALRHDASVKIQSTLGNASAPNIPDALRFNASEIVVQKRGNRAGANCTTAGRSSGAYRSSFLPSSPTPNAPYTVYFLRRMPHCSGSGRTISGNESVPSSSSSSSSLSFSSSPPPPPRPPRGRGVHVHAGTCNNNASDDKHDNALGTADSMTAKLVRYSGVDTPFLIHMHLGPADVYLLSPEELEAIPIVGLVPKELFRPLNDMNSPLIVNTTEGEISVVERASHWLQSPFLIRRTCPPRLLPKYFPAYAQTNSSAGGSKEGSHNSSTVKHVIIQDVEPFWIDGLLQGETFH